MNMISNNQVEESVLGVLITYGEAYYKVADKLIQSNRVEFYRLAKALTEKRVLDAHDFQNLTLSL